MTTYSFCESVHASGASPWHIRKLDAAGLKLSGGITSNSLCDRVRMPYGWDLRTEVDSENVARLVAGKAVCVICASVWRQVTR